MPKLTNTNILKKQIIEALEKSLGIVTNACKEVGISRWTFYEWCKNDSEFKKQVEDINEITIDFVESALYKNIANGKEVSILFFLKTRAKHRGYVETDISAYQDQTVSFKFTEVK